ncbi:glycine zipper 2TM domain-containing protein [Paraburkholderia sediminicola]|uniref:glycine zipper 2TM domain-containing protein n=1 Tax=Paraburkholderia sediminicola TaxID=458836 RepID=UPI0038BC0D08
MIMKSTRLSCSAVLALAGIFALLASGCALNSSSADVYTSSQAQREETVRFGVVESVRQVTIKDSPSGLGTLGGAALGAIGGSAIGGGSGAIATGIVGGIAGALLGSSIENTFDRKKGLEITVKLDTGDLRAITQTDTGEPFAAGERVRLLASDGVTRVTR